MTAMAALLASGAGSLSATASPAALNSGGKTPGSTTATTTVIVSGATGAITYAWTIVQVDGDSIAIVSPTSATTNFRVGNGNYVARCTVTSGGASVHVDIAVSYIDRGIIV